MYSNYLKIVDFLALQGYKIADLQEESEGREYVAMSGKINNQFSLFRIAKITPTKIGQFVTCWKRNFAGITAPYDQKDRLEYMIIVVQTQEQQGFFMFDQKALLEHDIISCDGRGGKRGFRVYPVWDRPVNKQALQTQNWQKFYFVTLKF